MVYAGQLDSYENSRDVLNKFLDVSVSETQVYRVTDTYGEQLGQKELSDRSMPAARKDETVYVELDGSMILTREEGWKEVKLSRVFKSTDYVEGVGKESGWITKSQYLAHLGSHHPFADDLYQQVNSYVSSGAKLVFISDGATWIRNWIEDHFDHAVSILDYYHASEYLHEFAKSHFKEDAQRACWIATQKDLLLSSKVEAVIANMEELEAGKSTTGQKVINYYKNNQYRMDYKGYKQMGVGIIGSGAIESAHRTVIQKRMKLSGQRWSKKGAQHMLNLRVVKMNDQWNKVIELVKTEFKNAA